MSIWRFYLRHDDGIWLRNVVLSRIALSVVTSSYLIHLLTGSHIIPLILRRRRICGIGAIHKFIICVYADNSQRHPWRRLFIVLHLLSQIVEFDLVVCVVFCDFVELVILNQQVQTDITQLRKLHRFLNQCLQAAIFQSRHISRQTLLPADINYFLMGHFIR